jgi:menaquinone-dependent protoporphyrinogen IX oxidase
MKSILIIYKSKTGFTQKYVDWIVEEVPCNAVTLEKVKANEINNHDIIIYGAGMHAGHIDGLNKFRKLVGPYHKKVIVFATGAAPYTEEIVSKAKEINLINNDADVEFYYFQSGINYERMGTVDKTIMKIYSKILELKSGKTELEEGTRAAILTSYDHSDKEFIRPLTTSLKELLRENNRIEVE